MAEENLVTMKLVLSLRKQVPQGSGDFFFSFLLFIKALLFDQHSMFWKKCQLWAANDYLHPYTDNSYVIIYPKHQPLKYIPQTALNLD